MKANKFLLGLFAATTLFVGCADDEPLALGYARSQQRSFSTGHAARTVALADPPALVDPPPLSIAPAVVTSSRVRVQRGGARHARHGEMREVHCSL